jgi:hypothetical protein
MAKKVQEADVQPITAAVEQPTQIPSTKRTNAAGRKIPERCFGLAEFGMAHCLVELDPEWTFEETLKPEAWALVAHRFKSDPMTGRRDLAGARITVRTRNLSWEGELTVIAVEEASLQVMTYKEPVHYGIQTIQSDLFRLRWNATSKLQDIIRISDAQVVASVKTVQAAQDWVDKMVKAA